VNVWALPQTADRWDVVSYVAIIGAAIVRVFIPLLSPDHYQFSIGTSSLLWALGFLLFAARYGPLLSRPRLDGKSV